MLDFEIDGALILAGFDQMIVQAYLEEIAEMARAEWIRLAQASLRGTASDYIAGIQPVEYGQGWAIIRLMGWFPNAIENGLAPFNMKPGLLAGPKAKTSWSKASKRSGAQTATRYVTVPFRHGTPASSGKNVVTPMPYTHVTKGGKPASLIYSKAQKLVASTMGPGGVMKWGGKLAPIKVGPDSSEEFAEYGQRTMLPVAHGRPGPYTWKNSPYAGMYKVQHTYEKAVQNQYVTFRRVSDTSDPRSWWHPGISARSFAPRVLSFVEGEAATIFA